MSHRCWAGDIAGVVLLPSPESLVILPRWEGLLGCLSGAEHELVDGTLRLRGWFAWRSWWSGAVPRMSHRCWAGDIAGVVLLPSPESLVILPRWEGLLGCLSGAEHELVDGTLRLRGWFAWWSWWSGAVPRMSHRCWAGDIAGCGFASKPRESGDLATLGGSPWMFVGSGA